MTDQLKALIEELKQRKTEHIRKALVSESMIYEAKFSECDYIIEKLKLILTP